LQPNVLARVHEKVVAVDQELLRLEAHSRVLPDAQQALGVALGLAKPLGLRAVAVEDHRLL